MKYFIHNSSSWGEDDYREISGYLSQQGYSESMEAAIGEGAGGPGWETVIEVVLHVSAVVGLGEQIWKLAKFLHNKRPLKKAPEGQPEIYKLVVHADNMIIGIDLLEDLSRTERALHKLDMEDTEEVSRMYQNKDQWDKF